MHIIVLSAVHSATFLLYFMNAYHGSLAVDNVCYILYIYRRPAAAVTSGATILFSGWWLSVRIYYSLNDEEKREKNVWVINFPSVHIYSNTTDII